MPFYALPYHIGVWKGMEGHKKGNGYKLEEGLLSSQIPQARIPDANPNEINIQGSSAGSSGLSSLPVLFISLRVLFACSLLILLHQSARVRVCAIL